MFSSHAGITSDAMSKDRDSDEERPAPEGNQDVGVSV